MRPAAAGLLAGGRADLAAADPRRRPDRGARPASRAAAGMGPGRPDRAGGRRLVPGGAAGDDRRCRADRAGTDPGRLPGRTGRQSRRPDASDRADSPAGTRSPPPAGAGSTDVDADRCCRRSGRRRDRRRRRWWSGCGCCRTTTGDPSDRRVDRPPTSSTAGLATSSGLRPPPADLRAQPGRRRPAPAPPPPRPSRRRTSGPGTAAPGSWRATGAPASTGPPWSARWPTATYQWRPPG